MCVSERERATEKERERHREIMRGGVCVCVCVGDKMCVIFMCVRWGKRRRDMYKTESVCDFMCVCVCLKGDRGGGVCCVNKLE